jgi:hypothetical protein
VLATSAVGEVVTVEFEGVVSASECVGTEPLAQDLARPGDKVRGRFQYDTAASSKQRGANSRTVYNLNLSHLRVELDIGPRRAFDEGRYQAVVSDGLLLGLDRPKFFALDLLRENAVGWPAAASIVQYGITLDFKQSRHEPSNGLPRGFDITAIGRARWFLGGYKPRGNLRDPLWSLCGDITAVTAP